jgi:hypothetical protein
MTHVETVLIPTTAFACIPSRSAACRQRWSARHPSIGPGRHRKAADRIAGPGRGRHQGIASKRRWSSGPGAGTMAAAMKIYRWGDDFAP